MPERRYKYLQEWDDIASNPHCPALKSINKAFMEGHGIHRGISADSKHLAQAAELYLEDNQCQFVVDGVCALQNFLANRAVQAQASHRKGERE
jgi:hypothetical protein